MKVISVAAAAANVVVGAAGKTIGFGLLKRNGKVYTEIVPNVAAKTLQAITRGRVSMNAVVHADKWRGYDGLVDVGYEKHFRVDHRQGEYVSGNLAYLRH